MKTENILNRTVFMSLLLSFVGFSGQSLAVPVISLTAEVGFLDINISGLQPQNGEKLVLTSFSMDIVSTNPQPPKFPNSYPYAYFDGSFDQSNAQSNSLEHYFGSSLGNVLSSTETTVSGGGNGADGATVYEKSLLDSGVLVALQSDSFLLAKIPVIFGNELNIGHPSVPDIHYTIAAKNIHLTFDGGVNALAEDASLFVRITDAGVFTSVPEPSSFVILAICLFGLGVSQKRKSHLQANLNK
jgi:hypothetical protein